MALPLIAAMLLAAPLRAAPLSFADHLASRAEFDAAILEYRRELFYLETPGARPALVRKLLGASVLGRRPERTRALADELSERYRDDRATLCLAELYRGRAAYAAGNHALARASLDRAACEEPDRSDARYWAALSRLRERDVPEARRLLGEVSPASPRSGPARELASAAELRLAAPRRSPYAAAGLNALLPGSGYAYADSPRTAAAALLTNAVFIWATYRTASDGNVGAATVLGLFSFAWYFGGVYGGATAADRFNRRAEDRFFSPFETD